MVESSGWGLVGWIARGDTAGPIKVFVTSRLRLIVFGEYSSFIGDDGVSGHD